MIHIAWPLAGLTWLLFLGEQLVDAVTPSPVAGTADAAHA
jgi:hypothetical protein